MRTSRRSFLGRLAAATSAPLLAPFMQTLAANAAGQPPKKRLVLFLTANGLPGSLYRPANVPAPTPGAPGRDTPLMLREIFSALEPFKKDVLLLDGFYNPHGHDLHGNQWASTCVMPEANGPGGISIDRFIARSLGTNTAFSSLNLATVPHYQDAIHRSADGRGQRYPAEVDPVRAYAQIFASGMQAGGTRNRDQALAALAREQSLLKFVKDDVSRLSRELGSLEKMKLDQYLEGLTDVERQIKELSATQDTCRNVPAPEPSLQAAARASLPTALPDALIEAHLGLAVSALSCGLTNVVSIAFGTSDGGISHYGFGALTHKGSHHQYCHDAHMAALTEIHGYIFTKIASFWRRLREIPEDNGSMADNTIALIVNDGGGTHHSGYHDMAAVTIGAAGVLKTGRHLLLPRVQEGGVTRARHCISDLYVSVANALGVPATSFGDPAHCKGPLPGLT